MFHPILTWLYRKLGRFYPAAFLAVELQSAFFITAGTLGLYTFYYESQKENFLLLLAIALGLTAIAVLGGIVRGYRRMRPLRRWIAGDRSPKATQEAWRAGIGLPLEFIRRDLPLPILVVVCPVSVAAIFVLDLNPLAFFPFLAGGLVAMGYSMILHYFALEAGMRPVLVDISSAMPSQAQRDFPAMPLRVKLLAALPIINVITGLVVAALTSKGGGAAGLGLDVLIAMAVASTISLELTLLLTKSIVWPVDELEKATVALRKGDYGRRVPVTTGDELGALSAAFNHMAEGLAEREQLREAFGTYLDKEVAEYILSEGYSPEGVEVEVSILFCDVQDFTRFASEADAQEVVGRLNRLFETIVPIVGEHGGHVDKFVGDGLLAVFGAPEAYRDHADRAVRAALEMAERVNADADDGGFRVGIGVNSGPVIAGSIGGAGRLNFSVIGDPVNVAARVESATRQTGDDVLITEETRRRLQGDFELEPRGPTVLKGKDEPVTLFAPKTAAPAKPSAGPLVGSRGDGD